MMEEAHAHPEVVLLDPASRRVGTVLDGKWTLDRLLGVGGMAAVYEGTHRNGARAAIKLFPFSVTTSPEFAERILREGYLANKIGHPAVVRVLDDHLDREREYAYLVMELLEGETARQRIERLGPMSPLEAIDFAIELTECLGAAHDKGVVHRDIKPENIFLTEDGSLKVLDFGVARAVDGSSSFATRTGAALGTPAYMSPEQARGRPSEISPRSDLYAVGATLLFLVSAEFLHEGESAQEIMVRAAWTPARKMRDRGLGIPEPLAAIIDKACEFDQTQRYASAADLRSALEAARHALLRTPEGIVPIVRPSRPIPPPGATITEPGRHRAVRFGATTLADETPPPSDGGSLSTLVETGRRRGYLVGGALTAILLLTAVILWPEGGADRASSTASSADRPLPRLPVAVAPKADPAAASAVAAVAPPRAGEETPVAPVAPLSASAEKAKRHASRPASGSAAKAHAPAIRKVAPAGAPSPLSSVKPTPIGRDVGY